MIDRLTRFTSCTFSHEPLPVALWLLAKRAATWVADMTNSYLYDAPGLHLGSRTRITGGRHVKFGKNCYIHGDLWLDAISEYRGQRFHPLIEIGDQVCMSRGVHVSCIQQVRIQAGVLIGSQVYISDHSHGTYAGTNQSIPGDPPAGRPLTGGPVTIGERVWIGDNTVIVGPVKVGEEAIIGANSVVKRDVAPRTIVAGSPARPIKSFNPAKGTWDRV